MPHWNQAICIDAWEPDPTYDGLFPKGAREKEVYTSPAAPYPPRIRPRHRYLFKKSSHRYPWQFWMEIIAYRIGGLMGVPVPPAYPGQLSRGTSDAPECGALIEWFYDEEAGERYVDGGLLLMYLIEGFDRKRGTQHNLKAILEIFPEWHAHWAKVLTFDTIIGNLDRHQDNWGVIVCPETSRRRARIMPSPAFDNGTALGHEILARNLAKFLDEQYLEQYLTNARARHHMHWSLVDKPSLNFFQFMGRFVGEYPRMRATIHQSLRFNLEDLESALHGLTEIEMPKEYALSQQRLEHVLLLVLERKARLESTLEIS